MQENRAAHADDAREQPHPRLALLVARNETRIELGDVTSAASKASLSNSESTRNSL